MRKVSLFVALLSAVLTPSASYAGGLDDLLGNVAQGFALVNVVKDLIGSGGENHQKPSKTENQPIENRLSIDPLCQRRVVIDESQISITGDAGDRFQDVLLSKLRSKLSASGKVVIVISGRDLEFVAQVHDQIHDSGRYSQASRSQVKKGKWLAPTDIMKLSGTVDLQIDERQSRLQTGRGGIDVSRRKVTVIVHLILEPVEILSGAYSPPYEASAKLSKVVDFNVNGFSPSSFGNTGNRQENAENELLFQAGSQALTSLVNQLDPEKLEVLGQVKAQPTPQPKSVSVTGEVNLAFPSGNKQLITIPTTKPVSVSSQIWFVRNGAVAGKFRVLAINGHTLKLETISGCEPSPGDGFAIRE